MEWRLVDDLIDLSLAEDLPWGDITSEGLIPRNSKGHLVFVLKQEGVIAGLPLVKRVLQKIDPTSECVNLVNDGQYLKEGTQLARVAGCSRSLLKAERTALNFLQRLCGVATLTRQFVQEASKGSNSVRVVDTRKTTPGYRYLEKYAVRMGGGHNHRFSLSDAVLIKDNHLALFHESKGSFTNAIKKIRSIVPHTVSVEVEVDRIDQLQEVLDAGVDAILLDNMTCSQLKEAVRLIDGRAITEASGNVNLKTIREIAATGIDIISVGALTHSSPSLDISLDYE